MSSLFVGIDIGKSSHAISFLSKTLLERHKRVDKCPHLSIEQSRAGFEQLLKAIRRHADDADESHCHVLMESTGHYGASLEQFLQEHNVMLYRIHPQERYGKNKTDKRDARALSVILYNQIALGQVVDEKSQKIYRLLSPNPTVRLLRGLVQRHSELVRDTTRRKNKLTAIADEIFPELTHIYKNPNTPSALALRNAYPTTQSIANASVQELRATRTHTRPGNKAFVRLQELATTSIGTKDIYRQQSLIMEQQQLIIELDLLSRNEEILNAEIERIIAGSREGQILTSFIGIGPTHASVLISQIGNIANFEKASHLRAYAGWSPQQSQTGTSYDHTKLDKGGNGLLKWTVYLITLNAIRYDPRWRTLYRRLVPKKCSWDESKKRSRGKNKVVGRIAGQILKIIFILLKKDHDLLAALEPGTEPPPPELYSSSHASAKRKRVSAHASPLPSPSTQEPQENIEESMHSTAVPQRRRA